MKTTLAVALIATLLFAISLGVMDEASSATGFALVKLPTATENMGSTE